MLMNFLKQSWLVIVSALVFGLLVAVVQGQLDGRIKANERKALEDALHATFGGDAQAQEQNTTGPDGTPLAYYSLKSAAGENLGYAIQFVGGGFADKISLLVSVGPGVEEILGIAVLKSSETPGFGDKISDPVWQEQFAGVPAGEKLEVVKTGDAERVDNQIVAITGATISSDAVTTIVNKAVQTLRSAVQSQRADPEQTSPTQDPDV